ncbi:MAG TPA: STAS domain-containing protein [Verrucomicrobiales bacterium]|nr:STAS domain-containing protein [Verrucomicrobiales bacterium]
MLFGCIEDAVWIRPLGRGSFETSPYLKRLADRWMDRGKRLFLIDLEDCPVMDSTFMGTLLGIATRLMNREGQVGIVGANERNLRLLRNLGLDAVLVVDAAAILWPEIRKRAVESLRCWRSETDNLPCREEKAQVMLEAHQALAELGEHNAEKFQDVIEFLRADVKSARG